MSVFSNLKMTWKAMTPKEKWKTIIQGVCDVGSDLLMGMLVSRVVPENEKRWKKAAIVVVAGGLGMAAGKVAGESIGDMMDILMPDREEEEDKETNE